MLRTARASALVLLAWLAGCGSPGPNTGFGRPAVLARREGEARMLRGRKPMWIKVDPQPLGSRTFTVGMEDIPSGDSIGVHKHLEEDEIVFAFNTPGFEKCLRLLSAPAGERFVPLPDSTVAAARKACHQVPRRM
jgi:hypothetical protein